MEITKKQRIWELDAFRGVFIVGMVVVHILYDIKYMFGEDIYLPPLYDFVKDYGSALFILLSGICVTLGRRSVKRGLTVLALGMGISVVMEVLKGYDSSFIPIYFGILHLLGVCMLLYPLYKRLPLWVTATLGVAIYCAKFLIEDVWRTNTYGNWLLPFGITDIGMADYFPLIPHLGVFMIGTVLGRTLYKSKESLLPQKIGDNAVVRFFSLCGRASLWIYVAHQPIVYGVLYLIFG